jgi:hypothetical protein
MTDMVARASLWLFVVNLGIVLAAWLAALQALSLRWRAARATGQRVRRSPAGVRHLERSYSWKLTRTSSRAFHSGYPVSA